MVQPPKSIRSLSEDQVLELVWESGKTTRFPFRFLRQQCPCAACVNEFTGERILDPESVPQEIQPEGLGFSGNYGLKIGWSDGHHSGIYTWERFEELQRFLEEP